MTSTSNIVNSIPENTSRVYVDIDSKRSRDQDVDDIDVPNKRLNLSYTSEHPEKVGVTVRNIVDLQKSESFEEDDIFSIRPTSASVSSTVDPSCSKKGLNITSNLEHKDDVDQSDSRPISSSSYKKDKSVPVDFFSMDHNDLSTSFCETESIASLSQSTCSEDFFQQTHPKTLKKKKKQKHTNALGDISKSVRPNYFVGIQVSNPEIHKAVVDVQNSLLSFDEKLSPSLVDVATLHLTLLVAHIETETDLHVACSALDQCGASLSQSLSNPPLNLKFEEISHFSHQVLYAKLVQNEDYRRLVSAATDVRKTFSEMGVTLPDKRDLIPHLTIAKLSKVPRGKGKSGIRKIDPNSYEKHRKKFIGEQLITGFQLLCMNKPKDSNRYYQCDREVLFDVIPNESSDHSLCCFPRQPATPKLLRRKFHTGPVYDSTSPSLFSNPKTPPKPPSLPSRTFGVSAVVGCAALLSIAFAVSRWMKKD